jgi:hypothetical protein
MSRGLVYEDQARSLIGGDVPLLAPGRKGNGSNPDLGDTETGTLKFPFDLLGTLEPSVEPPQGSQR